jgi:hypothetical protein
VNKFIALVIFILGACVSRTQVQSDYSASKNANASDQKRTLVFFLMDGFSAPLARSLLSQGALPNIQNFLLGEEDNFTLGRAQFPTLTYPNISSILTSKKVGEHAVVGNQVWVEDEVENLESPLHVATLNKLLGTQSIFKSMTAQKRNSVSIAPVFGDGATANFGLDLDLGLYFQDGEYDYVDTKLLDTLQILLSKTKADQWPEFVFVHLVGIDSYSHSFGSNSAQVLRHAKMIDTRLGPIFELIKKVSTQNHLVQVLMTSDHGMTEVKKIAHIETLIPKDAKLINEGRFASFNFGKNANDSERESTLKKLAAQKSVEIVASFKDDQITILDKVRKYTIRYQDADCGHDGNYALSVESSPYVCPSGIDGLTEKFFYPYFATNLANYFRAPNHPEVLLLASSAYSFAYPEYVANHGGMTPDELFVPIFYWNIRINSSEPVLPTYRLLEEFRR